MTDIVDPGSINNGDTPDWDLVQAYFDAIYSVINSPGQLDNNNIKSGAAIAYSKLNLAGSIATADLGNDAVTTAKVATPTTGASANGSLVQQGTANTDVVVAPYTIPTTGFYDFIGECRSNNYGGGTPSGQVMTQISLYKGLSAIATVPFTSYEAGNFVRVQFAFASVTCTAGDTISLTLQSNLAAFAGIEVPTNGGRIRWELRSS